VYTNRDDARPAATGHAEEHVTNTGVNKTSALENCETSAEGRALARLGFAPKGARPSREEMDKARRGQAPSAADARAELAAVMTERGWDKAIVEAKYEAKAKHPIGEATDAGLIGKFREYLLTLPNDELLAANGVKS
jgi:Spy/CpxP family protein refolding chaperone